MYKYILAALLAVYSQSVQARAVAYVENKAGHRIVITDQDCSHPTYKKQAYALDAQGDSHAGCWRHDDKNVYILWLDMPTPVAYPLILWTKMGLGA